MTPLTDKGDEAIPSALPKLTKVTLAIADEQQEIWARQHPTEGNRKFANAAARIKELEAHKLLTGDQREKLAEAYAITGQFERAAKITADEDKKAKWKAIWKAVWKDDSKWCKCPDIETVDQKGKLVKFSQKHIVTRIFSHKLNKEVALFRCNACKFLNSAAT